ncbi:MAG: NADH-quinone oxidoreductase subunit J [candidate division Zixibacteria bacterium HGW-Zixibacteria-1]|nr:MAG: NADH-quinone oxidoreductase subunit J [candidate division Zixibacteria bacterium HGW-Zixibacteria-1]
MDFLTNFIDAVASQPVFYLLSLAMIISALMVVTLRNIFHCAIFLIMTLFCVAGIYILLNAEFLAAVQVLIYVGAVSVLMIFAIMLTSQLTSVKIQQTNEQVTAAGLIAIAFLGASMYAMLRTKWNLGEVTLPENNIMSLGKLLMTDFVLPFEVVSVLLLAALIGAVVLARRESS